jgi:hypothetical protein
MTFSADRIVEEIALEQELDAAEKRKAHLEAAEIFKCSYEGMYEARYLAELVKVCDARIADLRGKLGLPV